MLLRISFLLISIAGMKIYDRYQNKATDPEKRLKTTTQPAITNAESVSNLSNIEEPDHLCNRYFNASILSLGLAVLARTQPLLYFPSLGLIAYTSLPIFRRGERQILERRTAGHDLLYSIYIMLAFLTRQEKFIALGVFFYHSGAKMLSMNRARSHPLVSSLIQNLPDKAWLVKDGTEIETPLDEVIVGDIVILRAGETIPVDGTIIDGLAMIDQHALTGESQPVEKETGESVFSSTLIVSGQIKVEVTKSGNETTISKITGILDSTSAYTTSIQLKGERWANIVAMPITGLTLLAIPTLGLMTATSVSHSTFGNRLRIVAPIGTLNYLHSALKQGLLIKDGRVIEELDKVDTVLFDKTGTLTYEQPEVGDVITSSDQFNRDQILTFAASAEHKLTHPLARAILRKAEESNLTLASIDDTDLAQGYGITARIDNQIIRVGSARFMEMENVHIPAIIESAMDQSHLEGHSLILVGVDAEVAGAIQIVSTLRPEVKTMLNGLRERGIQHIAIVSGDHETPTRKLAESLGMNSCYYEVLPQQKREIVEKLQQQGKKVCFVGDGINDAIAMNAANVSVSLSGATSIATDTAQAILMDGSLTHLCDLFDISHKLKNNLWRSLVFVTVPSVISLSGALFWGLRLGSSFLIIYSSFILALGNAMLPLLESKIRKKS